jgi:hypothetical protein
VPTHSVFLRRLPHGDPTPLLEFINLGRVAFGFKS